MKVNNFSKVTEGNNFAPIPKGRYDLMVVAGEEKVSKTGNEYMALTLKIMNDTGFRGRIVWVNITGTEVGLSILKQFLSYNGSPLAAKSDFEISPAQLIGFKINGEIITTSDKQTNKDRNDLRKLQKVSPDFQNATPEMFIQTPEHFDAGSFGGGATDPFGGQDDDLPF